MRKYIYISIGGMLGAILRFALKNIQLVSYSGNFPLNTLLINITGSFILAVFLAIALELLDMDEDIRLGVATGFIGAYTTFSTFCKESALLIISGEYFTAILYIAASALLGLTAAFSGTILAKGIIAKRSRGKDMKNRSNSINEVEVE